MRVNCSKVLGSLAAGRVVRMLGTVARISIAIAMIAIRFFWLTNEIFRSAGARPARREGPGGFTRKRSWTLLSIQ